MRSEYLKKYLFTFFSINISLIPLFLITGPFLSDLSLTLCSLIYLIYILFTKQLKVFRNYLFIYFFVFYLIIILSSLLSENIIFSLHSSLPYIRYGLFIVCVWHTAKEDKNLFNKVFVILTIIYLLLIFDGYLQFFTGTNIFNYEKVGVRVSSFFADELILGSYVARFFPIYVGLYLFQKKNKQLSFLEKILSLIFFVLISILIIISGERTAFALFIITIFFMFCFLLGLRKTKIYVLSLFILSTIIFNFLNQNNFQRLIIETKEQIFVNEKILFFGERRHEYANVSLNIFKDNIVLGSGPRTYRINSKDDRYKISDLSWNTHPHNLYFQLLAETGLLGTILVFFAFMYFIFLLLKTINNNLNYFKKTNFNPNVNICFVIAIIINIFPLIPSGNFFNNWISIIYFYPISLFYALNKTQNIVKGD